MWRRFQINQLQQKNSSGKHQILWIRSWRGQLKHTDTHRWEKVPLKRKHTLAEREREKERERVHPDKVVLSVKAFPLLSLSLPLSSSSSSFFSSLPVFPRPLPWVPNILIAAHRPFDASPNHCEEISYCPFPLCVCVCVCDGVLPSDGYTVGRCMMDPLWVCVCVCVCVCADLRS